MSGKYIVIFDYETVVEEELSIKTNEIIEVIEINDNGWWRAVNADRVEGWVPSNYIQPIENGEYQPDNQETIEEPYEPEPNTNEEPYEPESDPNMNADVKICHHCGELIASDFVVARDKHFHQDHFLCCICNTSLTGKHFAVEEDKFYCIDDYHEQFSPKCARCKETIKGKYITALGKTWHSEHFVCTVCGCAFQGNRFRKKNDEPYCEEHYQNLFGVKCAACGESVTTKVMDVNGKQYHIECFVCNVDGVVIGEGNPFHIHKDKIYCHHHFETMCLTCCYQCKKPIFGQFIQCIDLHFHEECWKCANCEKSLKEGLFDQHEDSFFCRKCFEKIKATPKPQENTEEEIKNQDEFIAEKIQEFVNKVEPETVKSDSVETKETEVEPPDGEKQKIFTYEDLKNRNLPKYVNRTELETYLSSSEFQQVFGMPFSEFSNLRPWRQAQLKRSTGLF